jgi:hypothetical protein
MVGMLQILTYMLAFYLVLKGIEILQIGLASSRSSRRGLVVLGGLTLFACVLAAFGFVAMQDRQATSLSRPDGSNFSFDSDVLFDRTDRSTAPVRREQSMTPDEKLTRDTWARGRDARNKGWAWAEGRRLATESPCAELVDQEGQNGCRAYVKAFGEKNR